MQAQATGQTAHVYGETRYAARSWQRKRRVIIKAEVVRHPGRDPKNNPRFVVTNLHDAPETVYQFYCGRGDVENRLKELHHGLELDRTSCERFLANQFRVLLTLAAYVLFQELRRRAAGTACADDQVTTLRERVLKIAVWVERSVRRIVLHLPMAFRLQRGSAPPAPSAPRPTASPSTRFRPRDAVPTGSSPPAVSNPARPRSRGCAERFDARRDTAPPPRATSVAALRSGDLPS
jgi:hypothetical protein